MLLFNANKSAGLGSKPELKKRLIQFSKLNQQNKVIEWR